MKPITNNFKEAIKYIEEKCFDPNLAEKVQDLLFKKVKELKDEGLDIERYVAGSLVLKEADELYGLESEKKFTEDADVTFPVLTLLKLDENGKAVDTLYGLYFKQVKGFIISVGPVNYTQEH